MPDLILEDDKIIRHYDELCISCLSKECPLIAALKELKIVAITGLKVWECAGYNPDKNSPFYMKRDDPSTIMAEFKAKVKRLWQKLS